MRFSSVEKKAIMGATGLILLGFVVVHLLDNLTIFLGRNAINAFAAALHRFEGLLWTVRSLLIAAVIIHIVLAIQLSRENRAARPVGYAVNRSRHTTYAARTMAISGAALFIYILYHLAHFTFHLTHPSFSYIKDELGRPDVYAMVVVSFQDRYLAAGYVFAMFLLSWHLSHGISSFLQSLGVNDDWWLPRLEVMGRLLAVLLCTGYISIPFAVLWGILR